MSDLTFTTIEEPAREALDITRDEYAVCNYIQVWSAHPENRQPGYCDRTKGQIAEFIGITTRGIMKMLRRLEDKGLVERYSETKFLHRITALWFNTVTLAKTERKEEQSSPQRGTKFTPKEEQSSPLKRNKVHPHKDTNKDSNKEIHKENAPASGTLTPPFKKVDEIYPETLEAEKEKTTSTSAGGGGAPGSQKNGAVRVSIYDNELPGVRIEDEIPIEPKTPPKKTGRKSQTQDEIDLAGRVIEYLNKKAGRSFRLNANDNAKGIISQSRQGFTEAQMRTVIDFKIRQWGQDAQMREHINPVTLFRQSNFERYLQAAQLPEIRNGHPKPQSSLRSNINHAGGDLKKYEEKQIF